MIFSLEGAEMTRSLHFSRRVKADLRNYPGRCIAEAQALSRRDVVINVRLIYAEWDSLDPLTGAPGDTLSLFCHTDDYMYSGLAKVENKQLMEDLSRQSTLKIIILDERFNVVAEKHVQWECSSMLRIRSALE